MNYIYLLCGKWEVPEEQTIIGQILHAKSCHGHCTYSELCNPTRSALIFLFFIPSDQARTSGWVFSLPWTWPSIPFPFPIRVFHPSDSSKTERNKYRPKDFLLRMHCLGFPTHFAHNRDYMNLDSCIISTCLEFCLCSALWEQVMSGYHALHRDQIM